MSDRRGFLTSTDRAFLRGETDYDTKQGRYQRRQSIRERTRGAFRDFTLLYNELPAAEREKIFEPLAEGIYHPDAVPSREAEPPDSYQTASDLKDGLHSVVGFMYLGLWGTAVSFIDTVEATILGTEREQHDRLVDVTLTIEEQDPFNAIESAIGTLEAGSPEDLTHTETRLLLEFLMAPDEFEPSRARREAVERLDALDPFAVSADDDRRPE